MSGCWVVPSQKRRLLEELSNDVLNPSETLEKILTGTRIPNKNSLEKPARPPLPEYNKNTKLKELCVVAKEIQRQKQLENEETERKERLKKVQFRLHSHRSFLVDKFVMDLQHKHLGKKELSYVELLKERIKQKSARSDLDRSFIVESDGSTKLELIKSGYLDEKEDRQSILKKRSYMDCSSRQNTIDIQQSVKESLKRNKIKRRFSSNTINQKNDNLQKSRRIPRWQSSSYNSDSEKSHDHVKTKCHVENIMSRNSMQILKSVADDRVSSESRLLTLFRDFDAENSGSSARQEMKEAGGNCLEKVTDNAGKANDSSNIEVCDGKHEIDSSDELTNPNCSCSVNANNVGLQRHLYQNYTMENGTYKHNDIETDELRNVDDIENDIDHLSYDIDYQILLQNNSIADSKDLNWEDVELDEMVVSNFDDIKHEHDLDTTFENLATIYNKTDDDQTLVCDAMETDSNICVRDEDQESIVNEQQRQSNTINNALSEPNSVNFMKKDSQGTIVGDSEIKSILFDSSANGEMKEKIAVVKIENTLKFNSTANEENLENENEETLHCDSFTTTFVSSASMGPLCLKPKDLGASTKENLHLDNCISKSSELEENLTDESISDKIGQECNDLSVLIHETSEEMCLLNTDEELESDNTEMTIQHVSNSKINDKVDNIVEQMMDEKNHDNKIAQQNDEFDNSCISTGSDEIMISSEEIYSSEESNFDLLNGNEHPQNNARVGNEKSLHKSRDTEINSPKKTGDENPYMLIHKDGNNNNKCKNINDSHGDNIQNNIYKFGQIMDSDSEENLSLQVINPSECTMTGYTSETESSIVKENIYNLHVSQSDKFLGNKLELLPKRPIDGPTSDKYSSASDCTESIHSNVTINVNKEYFRSVCKDRVPPSLDIHASIEQKIPEPGYPITVEVIIQIGGAPQDDSDDEEEWSHDTNDVTIPEDNLFESCRRKRTSFYQHFDSPGVAGLQSILTISKQWIKWLRNPGYKSLPSIEEEIEDRSEFLTGNETWNEADYDQAQMFHREKIRREREEVHKKAEILKETTNTNSQTTNVETVEKTKPIKQADDSKVNQRLFNTMVFVRSQQISVTSSIPQLGGIVFPKHLNKNQSCSTYTDIEPPNGDSPACDTPDHDVTSATDDDVITGNFILNRNDMFQDWAFRLDEEEDGIVAESGFLWYSYEQTSDLTIIDSFYG